MKISLPRAVSYSEIDADFKATPTSLFRFFQDVAAQHSEQAGFGIQYLHQQGIVWVLSKLGLKIHRYPEYGEKMILHSWSRGPRGFLMLRDFTISIGSERVASGSSVWFYVSSEKMKVLKVPDEITTAYAGEDETAMEAGIETWASYEKVVPEAVFKIYPRRADYDATEHVNNTRYCEYVLDAVARFSSELLHPKEIRFQFNKEIGSQVDCLQIGLQRSPVGVSFVVTQDAVVFARGEVS